MPTTRFSATEKPELDELYGDIAEADLQPLWTQKGLLTPTPGTKMRPWLWSGVRLRELATRCGELVGFDEGGDRRVLALSHPDLGGRPFATNTLWGAVQYLGPDEVAPPHRHTPGALRFVLEGEGAWTLVDADPILMHPGDVLITPNMGWHEHHNDSDDAVLWFDGLDLPLVANVDGIFFEPGPEELTEHADVDRSLAERRYGHAGLVPLRQTNGRAHSPLTVYRWSETDRLLTAMLEDDDPHFAALRFSDPTSGQDIMPTLRAEMHRFLPGRRSSTTRTVGSSIWVVFRGSGTSVINGVRFDWTAGDCFVVPSWAAVDHEAAEPSDLFVTSDGPVIEALALARTATLPEHQEITTTFTTN